MTHCKLCLQNKELKNSHIIPEFMYLGIYDRDPKRFYEINLVDEEVKSRIEQKGKREFLLCGECESLLSKYEKYADENLYGKNKNAKVVLKKQSMTVDVKIFMYEFDGFNYQFMKLFIDSILWSLLISESFITPKYDDAIIEKLRLSILNESPLDFEEFPCTIKAIMITMLT